MPGSPLSPWFALVALGACDATTTSTTEVSDAGMGTEDVDATEFEGLTPAP